MNEHFDLPPIDMTASAILPSHHIGFLVDRQVGDGDWGFVRFECPVTLRDQFGCYDRPAGTCMIYEPRSPRFYHARSGEPLLHTWFLAKGPGLPLCLSEFGLPVHEAMVLGEISFLDDYIRNVRYERMQRLPYWQDAVTELSYSFFLQLGEAHRAKTERITPSKRKLSANLNEIRARVHADFARAWTVADMASICALNATRFAMDYTKEFGISPLNDLIDVRLRHAKHLLLTSELPLKQVASECGFQHVEHFIRLFHNRVGLSPGQMRR